MARNNCAPGVKKVGGTCLPVPAAPGCTTDLCTAKRTGRRDLLRRLRPEKPASWLKNPKTWLDTNNIDAVMRQYERAYPHFKYVATLPVDAFETKNGRCISEHCGMTAAALAAAGKKVVGMVFNLDRHDQSGSHWVMAAMNMRRPGKPELYFYDSFGKAPPKPIKRALGGLLKPLSARAKAHATAHSVYNRRAHQRDSSSCGLYAMLSLEHVLKGGDFAEFCESDISDEHAVAARDTLFSGPPVGTKKTGFFAALFS